MAIAFDASSHGQNEPATGPLNISHTCTGSNLILLVGIQIGAASGTITGVTYNGVSMTLLKEETGAASVGDVLIYGLANPSTGTHTIAINYTGSQFIRAAAASYTGASQTGIPDATASSVNDTGTTALATTVTTVTNNSWVFGVVFYSTLTSVTNGTIRVSAGGTANTSVFDTNGAVTPAGNKTLTANGTGVKVNTLVSFAPPHSTTGGAFLLNFL